MSKWRVKSAKDYFSFKNRHEINIFMKKTFYLSEKNN